jgi:hypothetical protein
MDNYLLRQANNRAIENFFARFKENDNFITHSYGVKDGRKEWRQKSKVKKICLNNKCVDLFVDGDLKATFANGKITWENSAD